eukprot:5728572-Amphidinium_carterae.1
MDLGKLVMGIVVAYNAHCKVLSATAIWQDSVVNTSALRAVQGYHRGELAPSAATERPRLL